MAIFRVFCNRCDRPFTSEKSRADALKKLERHVKKHADYSPELHSEIDGPTDG